MSDRDFGTCCATCQIYWTCGTKWCRGEKEEENICCKSCNLYNDCLIEQVRRRALLKKKDLG